MSDRPPVLAIPTIETLVPPCPTFTPRDSAIYSGNPDPNQWRTRPFRYRFLTDESGCVLIPAVCEPSCFSRWGMDNRGPPWVAATGQERDRSLTGSRQETFLRLRGERSGTDMRGERVKDAGSRFARSTDPAGVSGRQVRIGSAGEPLSAPSSDGSRCARDRPGEGAGPGPRPRRPGVAPDRLLASAGTIHQFEASFKLAGRKRETARPRSRSTKKPNVLYVLNLRPGRLPEVRPRGQPDQLAGGPGPNESQNHPLRRRSWEFADTFTLTCPNGETTAAIELATKASEPLGQHQIGARSEMRGHLLRLRRLLQPERPVRRDLRRNECPENDLHQSDRLGHLRNQHRTGRRLRNQRDPGRTAGGFSCSSDRGRQLRWAEPGDHLRRLERPGRARAGLPAGRNQCRPDHQHSRRPRLRQRGALRCRGRQRRQPLCHPRGRPDHFTFVDRYAPLEWATHPPADGAGDRDDPSTRLQQPVPDGGRLEQVAADQLGLRNGEAGQHSTGSRPDSFGPPAEPFTPGTSTSIISGAREPAVDTSNDDVYVGLNGKIARFDSSDSPIEEFGEGELEQRSRRRRRQRPDREGLRVRRASSAAPAKSRSTNRSPSPTR